MAWDARTANVLEGTGGSATSIHIPRPLLLFLEWSAQSEILLRFEHFCERHVDIEAFSGATDDDSEEGANEEQSLHAYETFKRYELFFEGEVSTFLAEAGVTEGDFSRACESVRDRGQTKRLADQTRGEAKESCSSSEATTHGTQFSEEKNGHERKENVSAAPPLFGGGGDDASVLLQMALSSLSFVSFCGLVQRWKQQVREAEVAARDLGIF
jgi:hypothetical protein